MIPLLDSESDDWAQDWMDARTRVQHALMVAGRAATSSLSRFDAWLHHPPSSPSPATLVQLDRAHAAACAVLGHDWMGLGAESGVLELPYCGYCHTLMPPQAAFTGPGTLAILGSVTREPWGFGLWQSTAYRGEQSRQWHGSASYTTRFALLLDAAITTLEHTDPVRPLTLWVPSSLLVQWVTDHHVEQWAAHQWRSQKGRPIQHVDRWQRLLPLLEGRTVTWTYTNRHSDPFSMAVHEALDPLWDVQLAEARAVS